MDYIQRIFKSVLLIVMVIQAWQCAAVQAPSGGPVDKTPPELISADPPSMTVNFNQRTTWLTFSEYLDENSIKNAITVYPALEEDIKVQYKGKRLRITWPDNLSLDRTYILNITKNLKDEHGVSIKDPVQVAYGTGANIDNGTISGMVFGSRNTSLLLWQINPDSLMDSLIYQDPDYEIQTSEKGDYSFGFLPEGTFKMAAFNGLKPFRGINPDQLSYGIPPDSELYITDSTVIENVNMIVLETTKELKLLRLIPGSDHWGQLSFNRNISVSDIDFKFSQDSLNVYEFNSFIYGADSTRLVFMSTDGSLSDLDSLRIRSAIADLSTVFLTKGKFNIDTLKPVILPFEKNYTFDVIPDKIIPINMYTDRPVSDSLWMKMNISLIRDDSIRIPAKVSLENPMWVRILPSEDLIPETQHHIAVVYDTSASKVDTILFRFKTSTLIGLGNLEGHVGVRKNDPTDNLMVEIKNIENSKIVYKNYVNSASYYSMRNVYEGKYTLMLFEDIDRNNSYSNGKLFPYSPGEWFYNYPDTIDIRGNWTIQADIK